jgi:hypothetical protein
MNMNYRSLSFAAGIVVLALSAGFIIHERGENKRLRAEVRDLRSENDRLSADLKAKMQSLLTEKSARNRSEMQARILSMKNDASSKQGSAAVKPVSQFSSASQEINSKLKQDSEYAPFWQKQQRRFILKQYGASISSLGLPANQTEELKQLLTQRADIQGDAASIARTVGLDGSAIRTAMITSTEDIERRIEGILGSEKYANFKEDTSAIAVFKTQVESVALDMSESSPPISAEQQHKLIKLYYQFPDMTSSDPQVLSSTYGVLIQQAAGFLDSTQLAAFTKIASDEVKRIEIYNRIKAGK